MSLELAGKVILITGSTGIGAATARLAAAEHASVFIVGLQEESCASLAEELRAIGASCTWMSVDLRQPGASEKVIERCIQRFGRLDSVFNVAGISGRNYGDGPVHKCTDEGWQMVLESNLTTMFRVCRAACRQMLKQPPVGEAGRGAILNMSSVLAFSPEPVHFATHAYAASKGGIISLTLAMASYYAPYRIRVNALAPGLVRTPMSLRAQQDESILEFIRKKQPLTGGILDPEEVAQVALFLLSPRSGAITGQVIEISGGWSVTGSTTTDSANQVKDS